MHIAIDASVLDAHWGGIPKYVHRIASELARRGDRVELLANTPKLAVSVAGAHEVGIAVKGSPVWREGFLPLWCAARRPDVLWSPDSLLPRIVPVPSVVTIHDLATLRVAGTKPRGVERSFRRSIMRSARRATRVIAVSQTTADDMCEIWGMASDHIAVIPNGVDDIFTPGDRAGARRTVQARWNVEHPFVLHVGSIEPRKGLDVLIDACERASADGGAWRVVLAGSIGQMGHRVADRARRSPVVDVIGPVDDTALVDLYRAAAAYAAPALYEGFGITPLEAMACGTPAVIAGGSGGLEEVSGPTAIVVRERSAEAWRCALEQAMDASGALIQAGAERSSAFRWGAVAAATRGVLAQAAGATGRVGRSRPA